MYIYIYIYIYAGICNPERPLDIPVVQAGSTSRLGAVLTGRTAAGLLGDRQASLFGRL